MPRLFTGLEIPPEITRELSLLRGALFGARWIDEDFYHLTLRFIGDIDHATASDVLHELERIKRQPIVVTLEGLGAFGGDKPRALVVKAAASPPLMALQAEQERIMRRLGLPPEPRKFTPHVTLARLRNVSPAAVADYMTFSARLMTRRFTANRFVLYSSRDSVGGGPYVIESIYPLGESANRFGAAHAPPP